MVITGPLVERLSTGAAEHSSAVASRVKVVLSIREKYNVGIDAGYVYNTEMNLVRIKILCIGKDGQGYV